MKDWPKRKDRFAGFLFKRKVPGVVSASYQCGWRWQDVKRLNRSSHDYVSSTKELLALRKTRHLRKSETIRSLI